jgi:tetratricopeptide (TPR) repeat protein
LNPAEALQIAGRGAQISQTLMTLDPGNVVSANNLGVADQEMGDALWSMGRMREAIPHYFKCLNDFGKATSGGAGFVIIHGYAVAQTAARQAQIGDNPGAVATIASAAPFLADLRRREPKGSVAVIIADTLMDLPTASAAFERDDLKGTVRMVGETVRKLDPINPDGGVQENQKYTSLFIAYHLEGRADFLLGDYAGAERAERAAMTARKHTPIEAVPDRRDIAELSTWLAMAIARQGRLDEAAQMIAPVVKFHRELAAKNHGDEWQNVEFAGALYAQALTDKTHAAALLREAAAKMDALPPAMRGMHDVRLWRESISAAARGT